MTTAPTTFTKKKTTRAASVPAKKASEKKQLAQSIPNPTEAVVYSMAGKEVSKVALPAELFGVPWRADLVHQVATAMQANARQSRAHTKDRSEVSGGGKKPWKQKGTGQARHGSSRSPLWRHGGVTFGPRAERDYGEKINRKMRANALVSVLSRKIRDGEVLFVDALSFGSPKTAEAKHFSETLAKVSSAELLATKRKNAALIALAAYDANTIKSFRNLDNLATEEVRNLNPVNVLTSKYLIIENPIAAFKELGVRIKAK